MRVRTVVHPATRTSTHPTRIAPCNLPFIQAPQIARWPRKAHDRHRMARNNGAGAARCSSKASVNVTIEEAYPRFPEGVNRAGASARLAADGRFPNGDPECPVHGKVS